VVRYDTETLRSTPYTSPVRLEWQKLSGCTSSCLEHGSIFPPSVERVNCWWHWCS